MGRIGLLYFLAGVFGGFLCSPHVEAASDQSSLFPEKLVHLDFKGAPLSIAYMESVFPLLRAMGASGLLVEYEDMFPYSGALRNLTARNHFSPDDIKRLLDAADSNNLTVIPLVQTFGHLEFVLKLPDYITMREDPENPQALCPSFSLSNIIVRDMLRQVAHLHKDRISHIHIGSDEVFVIGECSRCKARMFANNWTTDDLFLDHVHTITAFTRSLNLQPIMWDDMFRKIDIDVLRTKNLTKDTDIMLWSYRNVGEGEADLIEKYSQANFAGIWVASAFKGVAGPSEQMPQYTLHLNNNIDWLKVASSLENKVKLRGIALTGWSRFDHFGSLCELFPVGIPVLALCLKHLSTGSHDARALEDIRELLRCNRPIPLASPEDAALMWCGYPGAMTFVAVQRLDQFERKRLSIESTSYYKGFLTPMNLKHNFSSPALVRDAVVKLPAAMDLLDTVLENIQHLKNVCDQFTLKEWIETYWQPQKDWGQALQTVAEKLLYHKTFPRRPLYN
ncbi:hexosaminidase D [Galendromus occidentalis]|uniref:beta-N-acetylhexosaminidase n=1 Tax=Galendromus occidentalis TaxID=34638 RepID=A0AAJ6VVR4_9ACAR|nr:hexosaminidase D [Galendromus occidentalis]